MVLAVDLVNSVVRITDSFSMVLAVDRGTVSVRITDSVQHGLSC